MPNSDVSSLVGGVLLHTTQASFDVREESDVIALLRTIHVNALDPDIKNHLRDLIFAYRQSMTASDLQLVVTAFKELGILIVSDAKASSAEKVTSVDVPKKPSFISTSRPQPRFASVVTVKTDVEPIGVPSYVANTVSVAEGSVVDSQPIVVPEIPQPVTVPPVEAPEQKSETVVQTVVPAPLVSAVTYANPADRIKEIKHQVNEKVGNPINLIDAHNEVGREYMNALLDAMKKSNGGQVQEVSEAMARLEKAFVAVFEAINKGVSQTTALPEVHVEPVVSVVPEAVTPVTAPPSYTELESQETSSNPVKIKIVPEPVKVAPEVASPLASVQTIEETVAPAVPTSRLISVAENLGTDIVQKTEEVQRVQEPVVPPTFAQPKSNPNFQSVAEDKSLQDSIRLQREDISKQLQKEEAIKVSQMDPLETPEVTAGLGQLLSEWSLFKSSGIFGTGPSGKDHVLYLKLAPLTMSAVIAGRFEGVTPKIKQSIADYMNGWRYEEGVSHEHGETFEHYLRRVIYHILNKQKQVG